MEQDFSILDILKAALSSSLCLDPVVGESCRRVLPFALNSSGSALRVAVSWFLSGDVRWL